MLNGVGTVRLDGGSVGKLLVGVSRPGNGPSLGIDNAQGGEAISGTKLATPSAGDLVATTVDSLLGRTAGGSSARVLDSERASLSTSGALDAE